jgi:hypothetical protein
VPRPVPTVTPDVFATEIHDHDAAPKRASPGITATAINQWMRPQTLRQQFILTEILQQPLALRRDHL